MYYLIKGLKYGVYIGLLVVMLGLLPSSALAESPSYFQWSSTKVTVELYDVQLGEKTWGPEAWWSSEGEFLFILAMDEQYSANNIEVQLSDPIHAKPWESFHLGYHAGFNQVNGEISVMMSLLELDSKLDDFDTGALSSALAQGGIDVVDQEDSLPGGLKLIAKAGLVKGVKKVYKAIKKQDEVALFTLKLKPEYNWDCGFHTVQDFRSGVSITYKVSVSQWGQTLPCSNNQDGGNWSNTPVPTIPSSPPIFWWLN